MSSLTGENTHVMILIGIGILVFVYLLHWYIRSSIDPELSALKRKIRRLQINMQQMQMGKTVVQRPAQPLKFTPQRVEIEESDGYSENGDTRDADSYFDPTKA
jgi:hypothetical protein